MAPKYPGVTMQIGGKALVVPPLSYRQYVLHSEAQTNEKDGIHYMADICFDALTRNYPEMTRDEFDDDIDLVNIRAIFKVVMGDQPQGEAVAAAKAGEKLAA